MQHLKIFLSSRGAEAPSEIRHAPVTRAISAL